MIVLMNSHPEVVSTAVKNAAACYYQLNQGIQTVQLYEDAITRNPVVYFDKEIVMWLCTLYNELYPVEER